MVIQRPCLNLALTTEGNEVPSQIRRHNIGIQVFTIGRSVGTLPGEQAKVREPREARQI